MSRRQQDGGKSDERFKDGSTPGEGSLILFSFCEQKMIRSLPGVSARNPTTICRCPPVWYIGRRISRTDSCASGDLWSRQYPVAPIHMEVPLRIMCHQALCASSRLPWLLARHAEPCNRVAQPYQAWSVYATRLAFVDIAVLVLPLVAARVALFDLGRRCRRCPSVSPTS